jgi:peptidoglycan/xylan/chitin deacetylase (PgdA/CDA1 family)
VLFVPTDFVGDLNGFDDDVEPPEAICDWDDLRALARAGVSIQSHTASHPAFSELTPEAQVEELARSKAALEDHLEAPVEVVSYPYGDAGRDPPALGPLLDRLGYRAGCLYGWGVSAVPVADRFLLPRLTMGPDTDLDAELADGPALTPERPAESGGWP